MSYIVCMVHWHCSFILKFLIMCCNQLRENILFIDIWLYHKYLIFQFWSLRICCSKVGPNKHIFWIPQMECKPLYLIFDVSPLFPQISTSMLCYRSPKMSNTLKSDNPLKIGPFNGIIDLNDVLFSLQGTLALLLHT